MKHVNQMILSGVAGTSAMTLFSYIASKHKLKNFKEPELLGDFINSSLQTGPATARPLGWAAHYIVGIGFAAAYQVLLRKLETQPSLKNGVTFGALGGMTGAFVWDTLFKKHPKPPHTDRKEFYIQLLFAHLVYGVVTSAFLKRK